MVRRCGGAGLGLIPDRDAASALVSLRHERQGYGLYGRAAIPYNGLHGLGAGLYIRHQDGLA